MHYRNINKEEIQFDFIIDEDSTDIPVTEIEKLGGRIIVVPPYQHIFKYLNTMIKVFKENKYQIVHSNINTLSIFPLFCAKIAKIPIRIAHSHSTTNKKEWRKNFVKKCLRPFSKIFATDYFACTEHAARYLFGNKQYEIGNVYIMNNAIDLKKFAYDKYIREKKRNELDIDKDTLVIGHVGRFVEQKNHTFLVDIFAELCKENNKILLLLIGQGPLVNEIKQKVNNIGIANNVRFLGQREDINQLYQVMDLFLFPSLYEGLGMVAIEAQCAGLPCVCSTEIPIIAKVSDNICFVNLDDDICIWKDTINNMSVKSCRKNFSDEIKENYDIKREAIKLTNKYKEMISR